MESLKILFTKTALKNLSEITDYYEQQQIGLGFRFAGVFKEHLNNLSAMPNIGRIGKVFGTREFVLQDFPYVLVYRLRKNTIEILIIYHQLRKYPKNV